MLEPNTEIAANEEQSNIQNPSSDTIVTIDEQSDVTITDDEAMISYYDVMMNTNLRTKSELADYINAVARGNYRMENLSS